MFSLPSAEKKDTAVHLPLPSLLTNDVWRSDSQLCHWCQPLTHSLSMNTDVIFWLLSVNIHCQMQLLCNYQHIHYTITIHIHYTVYMWHQLSCNIYMCLCIFVWALADSMCFSSLATAHQALTQVSSHYKWSPGVTGYQYWTGISTMSLCNVAQENAKRYSSVCRGEPLDMWKIFRFAT